MSKEIMMIYADENRDDLGVLQDYSFDECYGDDDNTFEIKVQQYNHVCREDYFVYMEFTEYGGVIDKVTSNTKTGVVTYKGRTWHGILNSYVIEPEPGQMYRIFNGTANQVIQQIITLFNLGSLFEVDNDLTPNDEILNIVNFSVRYEKAYFAILRMLKEVEGKLLTTFKNGKVKLYTRHRFDYANNEEFDSTQVPFTVGKTYNNVNHLICLGQGDGADRAVIHLFTDGKNSEAMTIQPYVLNEPPMEDADYILDKRYQIVTGFDEMAEIYDYPNAEAVTNYKPLLTKPDDWEANYYKKYYQHTSDGYELIEQKYGKLFDQMWGIAPPDWAVDSGYKQYYYIDNGKFVNVKSLTDAQATPQYIPLTPANGFTSAPQDWESSFSTYYKWSDTDGRYISVTGEVYPYAENFTRDKRPNDWGEKYNSYSTRMWDGSAWVYTAVQGISENWFYKMTSPPSDWATSYLSAYSYTNGDGAWQYTETDGSTQYRGQFSSAGFFQLNAFTWTAAPLWEPDKYYVKKPKTVAPDWYGVWDGHAATGGIWRRYNRTYAPDFINDGRYYYRKVDYTPPWRGDGYYWYLKDEHHEQVPDFKGNQYYYQVIDRMKELVSGGIKKLQDLCDTSSLNVNLELTENYDVGDLIGSVDEVTNIKVVKPILRKVIRIKKNILSIEHQVE